VRVQNDISGLSLWLKADAGTYQERTGASATTPAVADTNPVGSWLDQSGSGNHFTATADTRRPLLKTNILNGMPVLRFDGVNDFLRAATFDPGDSVSLFLVVTPSTTSTTYGLFDSAHDTAGTFRGGSISSGVGVMEWHNAAPSFNLSLPDANPVLLEFILSLNSTRSVIYYNNAALISTNTNGAITGIAWNQPTIGSVNGGGEGYFTGDVFEVLLFNSALSASNRQAMETYLNSRAEIYISPGAGSPASVEVWDTDDLNAVIQAAPGGTILRLHAGTYTGKATDGVDEVCFLVTKNLTIEAYGDGMPILTYDPLDIPYLDNEALGDVIKVKNGVSNVILDGLEVIGLNAVFDTDPPVNPLDGYCVNAHGVCPGFIIRNCVVHDHVFGVGSDSSGNLIEDNEIYNIGIKNPDMRLHGIYFNTGAITISGNYIHHCTGYGVHGYPEPVGATITNNVVVHNGGGMLVDGDGHLVTQNTVSWNDGGGYDPFDGNRINMITYATNSTYINNIAWGLPNSELGTWNYSNWNGEVFAAGCTYEGNCYGYIRQSGASQTSLGVTDIREDPLFVVAEPLVRADFALQAGSPCPDAGADI
jgi:hypothetical protein